MIEARSALLPKNPDGTRAFVLGVIGLVVSLVPLVGMLAGVCGFIALVSGILGLRQKQLRRDSAGWGLVFGALAMLIGTGTTWAFYYVLAHNFRIVF